MEALQAASKKDARFRELIEHFAVIATEKFRTSPDVLSLDVRNRKLTMMLSGYTRDGFITNALITNFQDFVNFTNHPVAQPEFTVHCERSNFPAPDNPTMIQAVGASAIRFRRCRSHSRRLQPAATGNRACRC